MSYPIQSEYIQIKCFRVTTVDQFRCILNVLGVFKLNVLDVFKLNVFGFDRMAARAGDDESSDDGHNEDS